MKVKRARARTITLDGLDLEALNALRSSKAWSLVESRADAVIGSLLRDLERADDPNQVRRLQGELAGVRRALSIPGQLVEEIKRKVKDE